MAGVLYGVGVGPGDPELITLKAKRILEEVDFIAVPKTSGEKESLALSIVRGAIDIEKEVLELLFPMSYNEKLLEESWDNAVNTVKSRLDDGKSVAFITLGDPTVYSTYIYIHGILSEQGYETYIVPGVTSFCASAALAGISLVENREAVAVIPSAYECENLDEVLDRFDSVVLMKASKNFAKLKDMLKAKGLADKVVLVSRCGLEGEKVEFDLDSIHEGSLSYFTTIIVRKNGVR